MESTFSSIVSHFIETPKGFGVYTSGYDGFAQRAREAEAAKSKTVESFTSFEEVLDEIVEGLGITLYKLPIFLGTTRKTVYNWSVGNRPTKNYQRKLVKLAEASQVLVRNGLTSEFSPLYKVVFNGDTFLTLVKDGVGEVEAATTLAKYIKGRDYRG